MPERPVYVVHIDATIHHYEPFELLHETCWHVEEVWIDGKCPANLEVSWDVHLLAAFKKELSHHSYGPFLLAR